jgi:Outer membrane protein LpxR
MNRWIPQTLPAALAVLLATAPARAAQPRDTYSVIFENDLFYRTDRDYTNGIEFAFSPAGDPRNAVPGFLLDLAPAEFSAPRHQGQLQPGPDDVHPGGHRRL